MCNLLPESYPWLDSRTGAFVPPTRGQGKTVLRMTLTVRAWLRQRAQWGRASVREFQVYAASLPLMRRRVLSADETHELTELKVIQVRGSPVGHPGVAPMNQVITLAHHRLLL